MVGIVVMVACLVQIGDLIRRTKDVPHREMEPTDPLYPELLPPRWYMSDGEIGGPVVDELSHLNPSSAMRMPPTYTPEEVADFDFTGQDTSLWGNGTRRGPGGPATGVDAPAAADTMSPNTDSESSSPDEADKNHSDVSVPVDAFRPLLFCSECHDG